VTVTVTVTVTELPRHPRRKVLIYYFRKSSHGATNFLHVTVLS
jgi:hypothetical protein